MVILNPIELKKKITSHRTLALFFTEEVPLQIQPHWALEFWSVTFGDRQTDVQRTTAIKLACMLDTTKCGRGQDCWCASWNVSWSFSTHAVRTGPNCFPWKSQACVSCQTSELLWYSRYFSLKQAWVRPTKGSSQEVCCKGRCKICPVQRDCFPNDLEAWTPKNSTVLNLLPIFLSFIVLGESFGIKLWFLEISVGKENRGVKLVWIPIPVQNDALWTDTWIAAGPTVPREFGAWLKEIKGHGVKRPRESSMWLENGISNFANSTFTVECLVRSTTRVNAFEG